jgi:predicted translin family RNA/ssDNA-binding protein
MYISVFPGQGSKVCPQTDFEKMKEPHMSATMEDITTRLQRDRKNRADVTSPSRDIFQKTSALIAALRSTGCPAAAHEDTPLSLGKHKLQDALDLHQEKLRCGY